jgi:hypothetical protein
MSSLRNIEEDEAGRLRAFRMRFGRGWDAETPASMDGEGSEGDEDGGAEDSLMDLISGAGRDSGTEGEGADGKKGADKKDEVEMVTIRKNGVLVKVPALSRGERRSKS